MSDSKTEALQIAHAALTRASGWLQGEYAKEPDGDGAKVQIAVNDALAEVSRVLRLHGAPKPPTTVHFKGGPWDGKTNDAKTVTAPVFAVGHDIGNHYWLDTKSDPPTYHWDGTRFEVATPTERGGEGDHGE